MSPEEVLVTIRAIERKVVVIVLGIVAMLAMVNTLGTSAADAAGGACTDGQHTFSVLFLIDQSGSMGGTTVGGMRIPASDPAEQRRYAPTYALARVAEERLY